MRFLLLAACSNDATDDAPLRFVVPPTTATDPVTDSFVVPAPLADIVVFVDDGSGSGDEQTHLAAEWPALVDALASAGASAQVTVLDSAGIVGTYADPADAQLIVGTGGAGSGQALEVISTQLFSPTFLRPGAALHTIVVSDRQDDSNLSLIDVEFDSWYADIETGGTASTFSAIALPASVYEALVTDAGFIDVHAAEWPLETFVPQMAERSRVFHLSALPVVPTIDIEVSIPGGGRVDVDDWTYDSTENVVRLGPTFLPPAGATVVASYTPAGG